MNSGRESGSLPPVAAHYVQGQNTHKVPPSTQEISDEKKEQQTKSAEKKGFCISVWNYVAVQHGAE